MFQNYINTFVELKKKPNKKNAVDVVVLVIVIHFNLCRNLHQSGSSREEFTTGHSMPITHFELTLLSLNCGNFFLFSQFWAKSSFSGQGVNLILVVRALKNTFFKCVFPYKEAFYKEYFILHILC